MLFHANARIQLESRDSWYRSAATQTPFVVFLLSFSSEVYSSWILLKLLSLHGVGYGVPASIT